MLIAKLTTHFTPAQMVTMNDGFEGPPTHHVPPPGWNNCNDDLSTVDTQPGIMHNTLSAMLLYLIMM